MSKQDPKDKIGLSSGTSWKTVGWILVAVLLAVSVIALLLTLSGCGGGLEAK